MRVLILGGTGEARALAAVLLDRPGFQVTSSLAGRVSRPALPLGEVRVGGFGGAAGLAQYAVQARLDVMVDATHPFAARISTNAAEAAQRSRVPLLALRRPGWTEQPGDHWLRVPDIAAAAASAAAAPAGCVFVTTGRRDLVAFAADDRHVYLVRTVEPPTGAMPTRSVLLLDRGPFTVAGETRLFDEHQVRLLVTKDSGGDMTAAKLAAARARALPVVMVDRPAAPADVPTVGTVQAAMTWLAGLAQSTGLSRPGTA